MAVPSAISDLSTTAASNSPAGSEAVLPNLDNYLRAHASFIAQLHTVIKGCIMTWAGAVVDIPTDWQLCDGTNGTPDLRDKFIVGAGSTYAVAATGGEATVTLTEAQMPSHTHLGETLQAGGHSHTGTTDVSGNHNHGVGGSQPMGPEGSWTYRDAGSTFSVASSTEGAHTHTFTTSEVVNHAHILSVNETGSDQAHNNLPPYYALAYIAYVGA